MLLRSKYKFLIRLRENIWNTSKPLKFKKLKWRKVRRVLFINSFNKKINKRKISKNYFFLERFKVKHFFNLMLKTKKLFLNTFGPFKRNQISKIIKKSFGKGIIQKSYSLGFNKITTNNLRYDSILYLMRSLESKLLTTFSRLGIFSNLFVYLHYIKCGYVLVNNKIIRNPFFNLKEGDIISFDIDRIKDKIQENTTKGYRKYNKNKKITCKSRHLIFLYKNPKIVFVKNPNFEDVEYLGQFHWDLIYYLLKLKR